MDSTTRALLVALAVLVAAALGLSVLTGGMMGPGMAGQIPVGPGAIPRHGWMWALGMGFGGLVMLAFWGALIVGVVLLVRAMGVGAGSPSQGTPVDVLKRRYAAGEITREQYEQMRKDLDR